MFNDFNIFVILLASFAACALLVPLVKKAAVPMGAMDEPNARKIHKKTTPRLGGLAMFVAFCVAYAVFGYDSACFNGILLGALVVVLIGISDDCHPMNPKLKMLGQFAAALLLIFAGGLKINMFSLFGHQFILGWMSYPFTVLCILSVINAVNLIDGADGLASGISMVYFISFIALSLLVGQGYTLASMICLIMVGVILGFLVYNFNPASIFMGDSGSMFLGYVISAVALLGYSTDAINDPLPMLSLVGVPLVDTLLAIIRRLRNKKPVFMPDKNHMHHQFIKMGLSVKQAVLLMYLIEAVFALAAISYELKSMLICCVSYGVIIVFLVWLVCKTDIIRKHTNVG